MPKIILRNGKRSYSNLMVRSDDGRRKPRSSRNRTIITTRYGRWILARRKLISHLNGKMRYG